MLQPKPPVVASAFALVLHTPETHAYPAVQAAKEVADIGKRGGEIIRRAPNDPVEFLDDRGIQVVVRGVKSRILVLNFSTDLGRIVMLQDEMAKPRKAKPSRNCVVFVFSALRVRPREARCCCTRSCASWTSASVWQSTTKSSAYARSGSRLVEVPVEAVESDVGEQGGNDPSLRRALRVGWNTPSSITPALRNRSTRSRMLPSATSAPRAVIMT